MTIDEFLIWEEWQDEHWEFDEFEPVAMTGGTLGHGAIQTNIVLAVGSRLRGKPCKVLGSDVKLLVAGSIRYPDAFIHCSDTPRAATFVTDPVVVFEVVSPAPRQPTTS
jgi:Uma2 family endonuclease